MKNSIMITLILTSLFSGIMLDAETAEKPDKPKEKETQTPDKWNFIAEDAADINGMKVTKKDLVSYIGLTGNPSQLHTMTGKDLKSYTSEMLERLINQEILAQIATTEGFAPGYDLIKKETETMMGKMPEEEKKRFLQYLSSQKMSIDDFCKKKSENKFESQQFAIDAWFEKAIKSKIKVNEKEAKQFYDKAGDMVSASQILIKHDGNSSDAKAAAKKEAEEILKSLKDGKDFRTLAATKSHCNSNHKGLPGALAPFARGQMVQEFEDVAFSLSVGDISDVIETPFGFHIIRIDEKTKRKLPPYEQVKDQIKMELTSIKGQDKIIAKLTEAKKHWKIEVTAFK